MEFTILKDIVIIFALSTFVNLIFTKLKVPTIIGYMITGIIAGPHLLKLIHAPHEIELMAEIGVVLLMFTIGLEFSLQHLMKIRKVVFLGGLLQVMLTAISFLFISMFYGLSWQAALFVGFLTALSSTAIVLKTLQERSELTSNYGRTVLGILIFQDLMLVPLILFTNILTGNDVNLSKQIFILALKAMGIFAFVYVGNKWLIPKLLYFIAARKNQELFMMSILLICLAVALLTSQLGMSLAFGAFLAGLMIAGSDYSHNTFGNMISFKDTFTSFFFVSIGMLLDLDFISDHIGIVIGTLALVMFVKTFIAGGTGFILGHTFRGTVLVGLALSQLGEFSFILAKIGRGASLISEYYFQLFLAVTVLSMSLSPFLIMIARPLSNQMLKLPLPKFWVEGIFPMKEFPVQELTNHMVIIGKDIRAQKLALMAKKQDIPHIAVVFDPVVVRDKQKNNEPVIYGDAVNEPVLLKAHVDKADIVVVSVGDTIAASAIVVKVRQLNKNATVLARVKYINDMEELYRQGATHVVPEKFETAIELFNQVLKKRLLPRRDTINIISRIRDDHYGLFRENNGTDNSAFFEELPDFEINAYKVEEGAPVINLSLKEIRLRKVTGVTLLAVKRQDKIIEHPDADYSFLADDCVYLLGRPEQLAKAQELLLANS
ncbi:MAG: cation:proton antiporter [Bacteroidales bacterium]|nr:cation:proton antiporter [Bacteroidales bacterium]